MKRFISPYVLVIILAISSCHGSAERSYAPMEIAGTDNSGEAGTATQEVDESAKISPDSRKLIKTGDVSFETKSFDETRKRIEQTVTELKGHISRENESRYAGQVERSLVIRVPAENFDKLVAAVSQGVEKFDSKNIEAQDVTEEFVDIESRLRTKKELENRYREMLAEANKVEELLAIEKQIGELRADIESIEGRLKYLQNQVAYSTLSVRFYETHAVGTEFGEKFQSGFKNGWNNLVWVLVGAVNIWPFILVVLIFIWFVRRIRRIRNARIV